MTPEEKKDLRTKIDLIKAPLSHCGHPRLGARHPVAKALSGELQPAAGQTLQEVV